jgi:hypothetical protein
MKKIYLIPTYIAAILMVTGCDTTEDAYYPGPESDIDLTVDHTGSIRLSADGIAQTIDVKSTVYWDATIEQNGTDFTVEQSVDRGNGTVTVKAAPNYNDDTRRTAKLYVTARNINKRIEIDVVQSQLLFSMDEVKDYDFPEEGGEFSLTFTSTIGWQFTSSNSSEDFLAFNPSSTGDGDWEDITVNVNVSPNYTQKEREVTLALRPTDSETLEIIGRELPKSFTVTQAAGTLPQSIVATPDSVDYTKANVRINYGSTAPVTDAGVDLYDATGSKVGSYKANMAGDGYPTSGPVTVRLTGLTEGVTYKVVPYVESMVGRAEGSEVEFTTLNNTGYEGVKITGYSINLTSRQVTVKVDVESDIDLMEGGISIYYPDGYHIVTYTTPLSGIPHSFEVSSVDFMSPNTEYLIEIFARTSLNEAKVGPERFTTKTEGPIITSNNEIDLNNINIIKEGLECIIYVSSERGFDEFTVEIESDLLTIEELLTVGLSSTIDFINPSTLLGELQALGLIDSGKSSLRGEKDYKFRLTPYLELLSIYGPGYCNFHIMVKDADGVNRVTLQLRQL